MNFYFGLQISLFEDRQGLKFAFKVRCFKVSIEKVWVLKKNPQWNSGNQVPSGNPDLTPTMESPEMLTEIPSQKQVQPEDV
jgi:hypothetical protein